MGKYTHEKMLNTYQSPGKCKLKPTVRFYYIPIKMARSEKLTTPNTNERSRTKLNPHTLLVECKKSTVTLEKIGIFL